MYYTASMTHVCATCIYFMHTHICLFNIVTVIIVITLVKNGCFKGESPETFSIQVDMRRVAFYVSIHQLFISFGGGGRKGIIALYKALVSNFCKIM